MKHGSARRAALVSLAAVALLAAYRGLSDIVQALLASGATLDLFEAEINDTGFLIPGPHLDMRDWRNAILETVSRLGAMEPRESKDLFVLMPLEQQRLLGQRLLALLLLRLLLALSILLRRFSPLFFFMQQKNNKT